MIEYDVERALQTTNEVLEQGKDIHNFIWEMIKYVKDILVYKTAGTLEIYSKEETQQIQEIGETVQKEKLVDIIYQLSELERDTKHATQKIIMFQAGIIRLCNQEAQQNNNLQKRIEKIETYLKNGNITIANEAKTNERVAKPVYQTIPTNSAKPQQPTKQAAVIPKTEHKPIANTDNFWPQVVNELKTKGKMVLCTNLAGTTAKEINDMTVGIYFPKPLSSFGKDVLEKQENKKEISDLVTRTLGKTMHIKYMIKEQEQPVGPNKTDIQQIAEGNDIPFHIID